MNIFSAIRRLREAGVMGLNRRNSEYIAAFNPRSRYPLVDDKLQTKRLAQQHGIAVPELYGVIEMEHQVRELPGILRQYMEFVIKPSQGSGGDGILVIAGRAKNMYRKASGEFLTQEQVDHHVSNILAGLFSLGGQPDKALIEARIHFDPAFENVTFQGVPDVRIIVYRGVPVMAMVRLPTRQSDGKANLHKGAIGAGIDMGTGVTLTAVQGTEIVTEHPDTRYPVTGLQIPHWFTLLTIAARCHEMTGMGYVGVDLVLDERLGPLVLELNARPGLGIQIANRCGLLPRLQKVDAAAETLADVDARVVFAMRTFGTSATASHEAPPEPAETATA
jgi:alpha-L-glutamate ligase-like protein